MSTHRANLNLSFDFAKLSNVITKVAKNFESAVTQAADEFQRELIPQPEPTNFEKAVEFNRTAEVEVNKTGEYWVFEVQSKMVELALSLIKEETRELEEAVAAKDMVEVLDALGDILVVTYGMAYRLGYNADEVYDLIHRSNMSKFCVNEAEAQATVEKYLADFAAGTSTYDSPAYRCSADGKYFIVYNTSTGKILKNINYKPVDLTQVKPTMT